MAVLGYLPKLKMDLELEFCAHLLYKKYLNTLLILKKSMDKVSMSYLFSFSRYETKCAVIEFLFRQLMTL